MARAPVQSGRSSVRLVRSDEGRWNVEVSALAGRTGWCRRFSGRRENNAGHRAATASAPRISKALWWPPMLLVETPGVAPGCCGSGSAIEAVLPAATVVVDEPSNTLTEPVLAATRVMPPARATSNLPSGRAGEIINFPDMTGMPAVVVMETPLSGSREIALPWNVSAHPGAIITEAPAKLKNPLPAAGTWSFRGKNSRRPVDRPAIDERRAGDVQNRPLHLGAPNGDRKCG